MADLILAISIISMIAGDVCTGSKLSPQKRQNVINHRCYECHETDAPFRCLTLAKCGNNEICFTREFRDHNGRQGYHLGCESKQRCQLFKNAHLLVGKRSQLPEEPDDSSWCFDCCDSDDCNAHLCLQSLAKNATQSGSGTCPPTFVAGPRSCFYVANWTHSWDDARLDCQRRGADLASVNDQAEDFFLVGLYNSVNAKNNPSVGYWVGGYYITALAEWAWVDMTKLSYARWGPSQPHYKTYSYRIYMVNPKTTATFTDWMWAVETSGSAKGFVCERPFL